MIKILLLISLLVLAPGLVAGQNPPIGIIDFYGLRTVSEQRARQALQIKEGDFVPKSSKEAQHRLEELPNVQQALLNPTCCESGRSILYVGIREEGEPSSHFRSAPKGVIRLPETIIQTGKAFYDALTEAVQKGDAREDVSRGHAFSSNPKVRITQERFITFAAQDLKLLRSVLHKSAAAQHRALAALIIGYAPDKRVVVKDLIYGMSDPDSDVRNNSMRALAVIAGFAQESANQRIKVPVEPFIDMLNSIVWSDRNKASFALYQLTEKRDPAVLAKLGGRALSSLVEMSRWKSPGHAFQPFFLLGRVGNLSEDQIQGDWDSGKRESLIELVIKKVKSNSKE